MVSCNQEKAAQYPLGRHLHLHWIMQRCSLQLLNLFGHGGREQVRLALAGNHLQYLVDLQQNGNNVLDFAKSDVPTSVYATSGSGPGGFDQCISLTSGCDQCISLVVYFTDQWFWPVYFTGGFHQCISLVVMTSVFHWWF